MPYPNIAIPTYAELEPQVVAWAAARGLVDDEGKPLEATPMSQHGKTLEEIDEATDALRDWGIEKAWRDIGRRTPEQMEPAKHDLALEFGDILVTLCLQAAMHGTTLEQCKVEACKLQGKPFTWEYVGHWAAMLSESLGNPRSLFRFDAPGETGAIARCVEEECRIQLSLMGPECLALALAKIAGRQGEVVDGVFVKAGV